MDNKEREGLKDMNKTGVECALESGKKKQNDRIISELEAKRFNLGVYIVGFFWVIFIIVFVLSFIFSKSISSLLGF